MDNWIEKFGSLSNNSFELAAGRRRGLIICNNSDTVMKIRLRAKATVSSSGIPLAAGRSIFFTGDETPQGLVSIFCAGTTKSYSIYYLSYEG